MSDSVGALCSCGWAKMFTGPTAQSDAKKAQRGHTLVCAHLTGDSSDEADRWAQVHEDIATLALGMKDLVDALGAISDRLDNLEDDQ